MRARHVTVIVSALVSCGRVGFDNRPLDSGGTVDEAILAGLVARYEFEGTLADVTGHGHDGTCTACPRYVAGRTSTAADFDGTQYVTIPHSPAFVLPGGFSVALWSQFRSVDTTRENVIFSKPVGSGILNSWMLATRMPTGRYYFYSSSTSAQGTFAYGEDATNGRWTHLAGTWDGTTTNLYVDGQLRMSSAVIDIEFSTDDVLIGAELEGTIRLNIDALVDDVRVYDYPLSAAEVSAVAQ